MRTRKLAAAIALGIGAWLVPAATRGSCAGFPPLEEHLAQADVVFVGTVASVSDEQRTARVGVEEVWRGPELPAQVTVHGGFEDLGFTSADRYFEAGTRYLFAPSLRDGRIEDDACTATQPWTDELAGLRPSTIATPQPAPEGTDGLGAIPAGMLVAGLVAVAVIAVSLIAFRSRPS